MCFRLYIIPSIVPYSHSPATWCVKQPLKTPPASVLPYLILGKPELDTHASLIPTLILFQGEKGLRVYLIPYLILAKLKLHLAVIPYLIPTENPIIPYSMHYSLNFQQLWITLIMSLPYQTSKGPFTVDLSFTAWIRSKI